MAKVADLFCGAGGAARGLQEAGFYVVGYDLEPQPRYAGDEFHQADALTVDLSGFDAVWASPPCQAFTSLKMMWNAREHLDLVAPTREMLVASGLPYVIENVPGAPLRRDVLLCGTMFGLGVGDAELWRHRIFEVSGFWALAHPCQHRAAQRVVGVYGGHGRDRRRAVGGQDFSVKDCQRAMGIDWMTGSELSQAVPPAYSRFLGEQLIRQVKAVTV